LSATASAYPPYFDEINVVTRLGRLRLLWRLRGAK
jgi:hypothetical protein